MPNDSNFAIRYVSTVLLALGILTSSTSFATAQNPRKIRFRNMFQKRVDAQANRTYELTRNCGPWLILCATFRGDDAMRQANDLVFELRKKHRLNAFIYRKQFDFSDQVRGIAYSPNQENTEVVNDQVVPKRLKTETLTETEFEEIAVVVGNFPALDDARTQRALNQIKYIKPKSLQITWNEETAQTLGQLRERVRRISAADVAAAQEELARQGRQHEFPDWENMGPMRQAFVIPNPLLPDDFFSRQTVDKTILKLNKGLEFSLLTNPRAYSVRVATFRGASTFNRNEFEKIGSKKKANKLAIAAAKAHRLTAELRKMGVEAYEFHDRFESYVCVGSFDSVSVGRPGPDGRQPMNPAVFDVIEQYKAEVSDVPGYQGAVQPKAIPKLRSLGITFDVQPLPVQVPRTH